ncbi:MAG: hypothetical protein UX31_C0003G0008 [Candidatus Nomurabacteria bacterium GW2011_GWA1_46_11]|uniref:Uncharacterized protein n=1 Tax=Candidatus Nomurabacteria bacterium GW2011_GWA1_46_11 TaxID=1618732 RepID=A0A0G1NPU1_9BACT|nr:MAG: hypothetical protein UW69_C0071G0003 [Microgenomates group bacterium GW2011_GWA2_44_7]KKT78284.1 MAG: hypothetical protein UW73_C0004G0008 [Microgenomates group bacterium GW2011_GWB1_44_8]KKU22342.1 MAG: hypothetical protein UX31_C0003G0008 [Candidatus Nomurabacteria bacterium GW2011_GWA1_46_11]
MDEGASPELTFIPTELDLAQGSGINEWHIKQAVRIVEIIRTRQDRLGDMWQCATLPPFVEMHNYLDDAPRKDPAKANLLSFIQAGQPVVTWTFRKKETPLMQNETEAACIRLLVKRMGNGANGSVYFCVDVERRNMIAGDELGTDYNFERVITAALFESGLPVSLNELPKEPNSEDNLVQRSRDGVVLKMQPLPPFLRPRTS